MTSSQKTLPIPGELFEVNGCQAFLIRPRNSQEDRRPWVWYAPTLPPYPDQNEKWMFERFVGAGIAIAGIDVGESWGSPAGRKSFSVFHDHMSRLLRFDDRPALLPRSRGGLMLYNWAAENPDSVSCVAGIYPVCSLVEPWIEKACEPYGKSVEQIAQESKLHSPVERLELLAKAGVPIYHIHGDSDEVVPLETHSAMLAERYRASGGDVTLNVAEGQGHSVWEGFFQCEELVRFVIEHLKAGERRG